MKKRLSIGIILMMLIAWTTILIVNAHSEEDALVTDLLTCQTIDAGDVIVWNDLNFLYVKYIAQGDWVISGTHLSVKTSLNEIPQTKNGNPKVGHFEYKTTHNPSVTEYVYSIPLGPWTPETQLYLAAHAQISELLECEHKSAWALGESFSGKNWATYFKYTIIPNDPPIADATGPKPYNAYRNTPVTLYCLNSYDTDGSIVLYEWDFEGDGTYDWSSTVPLPIAHKYVLEGIYNPVLRVTDDDGDSDTDSATVFIDYFADDFNDNNLDANKWTTDVLGIGNQYQEVNQEAKFTVNVRGRSFLWSKQITIENWNTVTIQGRFKCPGLRTAEMICYIYDVDTMQLNGIGYDNWNDVIRYWYTKSNYVQYSRLSPQTYSDFKIVITKTSMQYWENGAMLKEIMTTAFASTTNFQLKIGGWDASSVSGQYIYFDDVQINAN